MPKVLIADELSPKALEIFRSRGVEVDVRVGLKKSELARIIGDYDGLAVRSATKVTDKDVIAAAKKLKVIGRAGIGVDNVDIPAATARGIVVMNTPFGNSITTAEHAIALMFALARQIPAADARPRPASGRRTASWASSSTGKTLGRHRLRQYRLDRRRARARAEDESDRLRSVPVAGARGRARRREGRARRSARARRFHHAAHAADRQDQEHPVGRERSPRPRRACASSIARAAASSTSGAARGARFSGHVAGAALRRVRRGAGQGEPAVRRANVVARRISAQHQRGAGERRAAGRRADVGLSAAGAVTNALNIPSISAEEALEAEAVHRLIDKLGSFAGQIAEGRRRAAQHPAADRDSRLASMMRPLMPDVNMVSAPAVLKQKGTSLTESKRETSPIYGSLIRIKVLTGGVGARSPASSTREPRRSSRSKAWRSKRTFIR
jgi:D-3-phosphoglycerate dehydrogenase / 2-oxoglutarate reductase